jgi:hypothetical protein
MTMLRIASIFTAALLVTGAASLGFAADTGDESPSTTRIWKGVFTAAQAERGKDDYDKTCSNCHATDLSGTVRAPSLKGKNFMQDWQNTNVNSLFIKLRDSMPANYPESVPDAAKINILTYLLQQNGFPAGSTELTIDEKEMSDIQILPKGKQETPNFALVRMVGCLTQSGDKGWVLTKTTPPAVTKEETATPAALKTAADAQLGAENVELISVTAFKPETHSGQRVEARGLYYRDAHTNALNLTSLETAGASCQ